jgi:hypothetical protein
MVSLERYESVLSLMELVIVEDEPHGLDREK